MKKIKKLIKSSILLGLLALLLVSCAKKEELLKEDVSIELTEIKESEEVNTTEDINQTRVFIDSAGRELIIPKKIDRVAVTGALAQLYVGALAKDKLVAISREWEEGAKDYVSEDLVNLPVLGNLYGSKGELNKEELLKVNPQIVIDIGQTKKNIVKDMDDLTEQTGIVFVHLEESLANSPYTFNKLGELLGLSEEAVDYEKYLDKVMLSLEGTLEKAGEKKDILYILGKEGKNVIAKGSYHSEILEYVANNVAVLEEVSSKGKGNEVDMEYILSLNPEYIFFDNDEMYEKAKTDEAYQTMNAIKNDKFYKTPKLPYNFLGFPPSIQRVLGIMWLSDILYKDYIDFDLKTEIKNYYKMFYHIELSDEKYDELMKNAIR